MRKYIKDLAHALLVTTIFCVTLGGTVLIVQEIEGVGATRSLFFKAIRRGVTTRAQSRLPISAETFVDNEIKPALLEVLNGLKPGDTAYAAIFYLTDNDIARILIEKHLNGTIINLVVDGQASKNPASAIPALMRAGVPVHLYEAQDSILHHKVMVIVPADLDEPTIVVTGSANWTAGGMFRNKEHIWKIQNAPDVEKIIAAVKELQTNYPIAVTQARTLPQMERVMKELIMGTAV